MDVRALCELESRGLKILKFQLVVISALVAFRLTVTNRRGHFGKRQMPVQRNLDSSVSTSLNYLDLAVAQRCDFTPSIHPGFFVDVVEVQYLHPSQKTTTKKLGR